MRNLTRMFIAILTLALFVGLGAGCASSTGGLQRGSARVITPTPLASSVVISNVQRHTRSVDWVATLPDGRVYDCTADDMVRNPTCALRQAQSSEQGESQNQVATARLTSTGSVQPQGSAIEGGYYIF